MSAPFARLYAYCGAIPFSLYIIFAHRSVERTRVPPAQEQNHRYRESPNDAPAMVPETVQNTSSTASQLTSQ
jgi:hypothetical protein